MEGKYAASPPQWDHSEECSMKFLSEPQPGGAPVALSGDSPTNMPKSLSWCLLLGNPNKDKTQTERLAPCKVPINSSIHGSSSDPHNMDYLRDNFINSPKDGA